MKDFGKIFWRILLIGIILLLMEGLLFKNIQNSIGSATALILFIITAALTVYIPLYVGWRDGHVEILLS